MAITKNNIRSMLLNFGREKLHLGFFQFACCYSITETSDMQPLHRFRYQTLKGIAGETPLSQEHLQTLKQLCNHEKNVAQHPHWAKQIYSTISFWIDYEKIREHYDLPKGVEERYYTIRFLWAMCKLRGGTLNDTIKELFPHARFISENNFDSLNAIFKSYVFRDPNMWEIGYNCIKEKLDNLTQQAQSQFHTSITRQQSELVSRLKNFVTNRSYVPLEEWSELVDVPVEKLMKIGALNETDNLKNIATVLSLHQLHHILSHSEPTDIFHKLLNVIICLRNKMRQRLHAIHMAEENLNYDIWLQSNIVELKLTHDQVFAESDGWCEKHAQYLGDDQYQPCEQNNRNLDLTRVDLERIDNLLIFLIQNGELQDDKTIEFSSETPDKFEFFFESLQNYGVPEELINFMRFNFHQSGFTFRINLALQAEVSEINDDCVIRVDNTSRYYIMRVIESSGSWKIQIHDHMVYPEVIIATQLKEPRQQFNMPITVQHIYEISSNVDGSVSMETIIYLPMTELLHEEVRNLSFDTKEEMIPSSLNKAGAYQRSSR